MIIPSALLTDLFPSHVPAFTDALGDQGKVAGKTEFFEQWQSDGALAASPSSNVRRILLVLKTFQILTDGDGPVKVFFKPPQLGVEILRR